MGFVLHGNTVTLHVRPVGAGEDVEEGRGPCGRPRWVTRFARGIIPQRQAAARAPLLQDGRHYVHLHTSIEGKISYGSEYNKFNILRQESPACYAWGGMPLLPRFDCFVHLC